ncbi:MAG: hypothetical protein K1X44_03400 [Alphaproteobacteria bacterium]|nr:hypothetical protein [Alphaproteobacteria bacterium]
MDDLYSIRKKLTFAQAEGREPLPTQLQLKEITFQLKARLYDVIYSSLEKDFKYLTNMGFYILKSSQWYKILRARYVDRGGIVDQFSDNADKNTAHIKFIIFQGDYSEIFDFIQFILRHSDCPKDFSLFIDKVLLDCKAAYRVFDNDTIIPIVSEEECKVLKNAFVDLKAKEFVGIREHLRDAGQYLTQGYYNKSIRESISAVEAAARIISKNDKAMLSDALKELEKNKKIHPALKEGFIKLYAYTSDEKGIRHAKGVDDTSDEYDALFMIGACASFISYLINKIRI